MESAPVLLRFFKALADHSRLRIVGLIADRERNVQELAALLDLKEPTVSHHLAILRAVDLVRMRADGNSHWYRLDHNVLHRTSRSVLSSENLGKLAARVDPKGWEQKVLAGFVEGERLNEIPASRRKRWVILKWLAGYFAPDAEYTEAEVNRVLKVHHEDAATIRREMIGYRMLARKKGVYWRLPESEWRPAQS